MCLIFCLGEVEREGSFLHSLAVPSHRVPLERVSLAGWDFDDVLDGHVLVVVALLRRWGGHI